MAVTTDLIGEISSYVLATDYTLAQFNRFNTLAAAQFANENPGTLTGDQEDEAVALLICHRIFRFKMGHSDKKSEKIGDYEYERDKGAPGTSPWLQDYKAMIEGTQTAAPYRGVKRADHKTSKAFRLSDQEVPKILFTDTTLGEPTYDV